MMTPAHYIVFHPENKRYCASVRATVLIAGQRVDAWTGRVWLDKPPGNEDPFVLGPSWVYSYCHATELRRQPTPAGVFLSGGSCVLFCSGDLGNRSVLAVDTVFWIAEAHQWKSASEPPVPYAKDVAERTDIWRFHLRFGGTPGGHKGKYTYEASLYPRTDGQYSRLPLSVKGERVQVALSELPSSLHRRVTEKLRGKRPVLLKDADLAIILQLVDARSAVAVVGNIAVTDPTFVALRTEGDIGCGPCQPKTCC